MAINTTPNLHLPQWAPNEKPAYLTDFNQAFASIDTGFAGVQQGSAGAVQTATNAYNQATAALQAANQAQSAINTLLENLNPSIIMLPATPSENTQGLSSQMTYNAAGAFLGISIITKETTSSDFIGTITIPNNISILGLNNLPALTNYMEQSPSKFIEQIVLRTTDDKVVNIHTTQTVIPNWRYVVLFPLIAKYPATRNAGVERVFTTI